jgi:cobalt/nickel transport system permease protein
LQPATLSQWSNRDSFIHRLDPRTKLVLLIAFIVSLALFRRLTVLHFALGLTALVLCAAVSGLPTWRVVRQSLWAVPFVGFFAICIYIAGDAQRAWIVLAKSYLSAFSVLLAISVTPLPKLMGAAAYFRVPGFLLEVTQLTYRYLFVLREEAQTMQLAFLSRNGRPGKRALNAAAGMVAVLFTKAQMKSTRVHLAMLARGYSGKLSSSETRPWRTVDIVWAVMGIVLMSSLHFF